MALDDLPFPPWLRTLLTLSGVVGLFIVGCTAEGTDIRNHFCSRLPLVYLLGSFLFIPICTYLFLLGTHTEGPEAVGIMILGFIPGGPGSLTFSAVARADTALNMVLTNVAGVVLVPAMPLLCLSYLSTFTQKTTMRVNYWGLLESCIYVFVPVAAGVWARHKSPRIRSIIERYGTGICIFLIFTTFPAQIVEYVKMPGSLWRALPGVAMGNAFVSLMSVCVGVGASLALSLDARTGTALTLEYLVHDLTISGIVMITSVIGTKEEILTGMFAINVYFICSTILCTIAVIWHRMKRKRSAVALVSETSLTQEVTVPELLADVNPSPVVSIKD
mmetsp:Transcript_13306/g.31600  ORF Transcript_13306/g.31600 Transcript_13306/m.31600 type:complete len:332 (+) Transcript_13306:68-1063(+)